MISDPSRLILQPSSPVTLRYIVDVPTDQLTPQSFVLLKLLQKIETAKHY